MFFSGPCTNNPCRHGTCAVAGSTYRCTCPLNTGWTGRTCGTCDSKWSGSSCNTCAGHRTGSTCSSCEAGWSGDTCEISMSIKSFVQACIMTCKI